MVKTTSLVIGAIGILLLGSVLVWSFYTPEATLQEQNMLQIDFLNSDGVVFGQSLNTVFAVVQGNNNVSSIQARVSVENQDERDLVINYVRLTPSSLNTYTSHWTFPEVKAGTSRVWSSTPIPVEHFGINTTNTITAEVSYYYKKLLKKSETFTKRGSVIFTIEPNVVIEAEGSEVFDES